MLLASCEQRSDDLSAKQIAARMSATYASARSYRDSGVAFTGEPLGWTIFKSFFGLHSLDHFSTELDRTRGSMTFVFDSVRVTGTPREVPQKLIDVRPISKGSSTLVPMLLLGVAPDFVNPVRQHDDSVHGAGCYVIRAINSRGIEETIWIEKRRFVIRRVRQKIPSRSAEITQTLDYQSLDMQ